MLFLFSQNLVCQIVQYFRTGHYQTAGLIAKDQQGVSRRDAEKAAGLLGDHDLTAVAHLGGAKDPVFPLIQNMLALRHEIASFITFFTLV